MMAYFVYSMRHVATGAEYIGLTQESRLHLENNPTFGFVPTRFAEHLYALRRGNHYNRFMSELWDSNQHSWEFHIVRHAGTDFAAARAIEKDLIKNCKRSLNHRYRRHEFQMRTTPALRAEIVQMLKRGCTGNSIARLTGVSETNVSFIRRDAGLSKFKHRKNRKESV